MRDRHALRLGGRAGREDDLRERRVGSRLRPTARGCRGVRPDAVSGLGLEPWPPPAARPAPPVQAADDLVADENDLRLDDLGDALEQIGRGAIVDRHEHRRARAGMPQSATTHSARFSDQMTTLSSGPTPAAREPGGERARGRRHLPIRHLPDAIAVVVDDERVVAAS